MKKILSFLRSMRFGIILLILILVCSLAGSVIPQGGQTAYYEENYAWHGILFALDLNEIFSSWYFIALMALLCLNLVLCSLTRFKNVASADKRAPGRAASAAEFKALTADGREKLLGLLKRFRKEEKDGLTVYWRNRAGFYGSFVTHLAILLTLVFAASSMYLARYETLLIPVGESRTLEDGAILAVKDFTVFDENGGISYVSAIEVTDKSGNKSGDARISVNYPFSYAGHKFYQQEYRARGRITIENTETGVSSPLDVEEACFLSLDGKNGMMYQSLYPGWQEIDGMRMPTNAGDYSNPAYVVSVMTDTARQAVVLPGETVEAGGVRFTLEKPTFYPGIRVKTVPAVITGLLYASFALMIAGLWLCFFHVPLFVAVGEEGYALYSPKSTYGFQIAVNAALQQTEGQNNA